METEFGFRAAQAQEQRGYAGVGQALPAGELRDPEEAVGFHREPPDQKPGLTPVDLGMRGRAGDSGNSAPLPSGDEAIPGGNSPDTAHPAAGDILTGWEDEREKFQMGQGFGSLVEGTVGAEPEEFMEEAKLDFGGPDGYPESADGLADMDSEVEEQEFTMRPSY